MKRSLFGCLIFIISGLCLAGEGIPVESAVVSATVFKDRAMVTREARLDLEKGMHTLLFSKLTPDLLNESVRISAEGPGEIKILDVKVEKRFTTEIQADKIRRIQNKIDSLNRDLQITTDNISVLDSKKDFIYSLKAEAIKYVNQKILLSVSSTDKWTGMLKFIDSNLNKIFNDLRKQNQSKLEIEKEINTLQFEIKQSRSGESRNFKEIVVKIQTSQNGKIVVQPSYLVHNASWYPVYDIRVNSQQEEAEISYFGMIQQTTGEDWNNVKLTLSTAEPMTVKSLPKLERWFIDTRPPQVRTARPRKSNIRTGVFPVNYNQNWGIPSGKGMISGYVTDKTTGEPLTGASLVLEGTTMGSAADRYGKFLISNIPEGQYTLNATFMGYQKLQIKMDVIEKHTANLVIELDKTSIEGAAVTVTAEKNLIRNDVSTSIKSLNVDGIQIRGGIPKSKRPSYSEISAKELSTVFEIPVKNTIPSDNNPHKITIAIDDMPVEFEYTSIPKILPKVYLKGKVINNKSYPLLEGDINVFVDDDFVNKTYLNTIVQSDTLELALGTDESIRSEKKLIKKYTESKGFTGSTKRVTYEYEIIITNNRKTTETLRIYDQIPIAMNEKIKISILEPEIEKDQLGNDNIIDWSLVLEPGKKKTLPFKYQVEYPKNLRVYGLE